MIFVFDTNILLHYIRESSVMVEVEQRFDPLGQGNESWISAVVVGEIRSIALQNRWGNKRTSKLDVFLSRFLISDININDIILRYAEIDAFSQGLHPTISAAFSARNMGKNDLWIAATASILGATLLTTDVDFNHLNGIFLEVENVVLPASGI